MEREELQRRLNEGIAAVRRGDLAHGRELLLQVVEADQRVEPAWLWLSQAVNDPADKLVALENALILNPNNAQAQAEARLLRRQLGQADDEPPPAPPPAAPAWPSPLAPVTSDDFSDDPYQCAYCGRLTNETDVACPHCGRSLLVSGKWGGRGFQRLLVVLCGVSLQCALLQTLTPVVESVVLEKGVWFQWNWQGAMLAAAFGRSALLLGLFLMLFTDMGAAYAVAMGVALLDLGLTGFEVALHFAAPAVGLNLPLDVVMLLVAAAALLSRSQARVRQRVELDRDAHGPVEIYRRGQKYRGEGKWALAALHFQKAAVLKSDQPQFYKALGLAQAQLGRQAKALAALREGASRAPHDAEFKALIEAVQAQAQKN